MRLRTLGIPFAFALAVACNCSRQQAPMLNLRATPATIDARGESTALTITALADTASPGLGEVTLQATAGVLSAQALQLDVTGTAEATWSCNATLDSRCQGAQTITARWEGLTDTVQVTVKAALDAGVEDAGAEDAGSPDAGPRCFVVITPDAPINECPLEDGGSCLTRSEADGGVTASCVGTEGTPCLTAGHCDDGLTCTTRFPVINGTIGLCTSWYCTTTTGSCGDGGYCIDLFGDPTCTSGAAGSDCGDHSHCRSHDAGVCLFLVTAAGVSRQCSYGLPGDPCNQPEDCVSVACQTAVFPPSCL